MLEDYVIHKDQILTIIENAEPVLLCGEFKTAELLGALKEQLKTNSFNLAVLGQFKRGKTTLLNSLLGRQILPTSVVPLTSIVTILKYGKELNIIVSLQNGSKKKITLDELSDYVTETGNPKNAREVRCVQVEYPSPFLENGVLLIDTPGIGSTFLHNTKTTYEFLDHLDAALFLMSADVPISQAEKELLDTIKGSVQKIFFILNKIDNLTPKEIEEITAFNKHVLKEMGYIVHEVFLLSAKEALQAKVEGNDTRLMRSGILNLEETLGNFFSLEKGQIILKGTVDKLDRIITQKLSQIDIEHGTIEATAEELENKLQKFHLLVTNLKQDREDLAYLLKGECDKLSKKVEAILKTCEEKELPGIKERLHDLFENNQKCSPAVLRDLMQQAIKGEIMKGFDTLRKELEEGIKADIQKTIDRFTRRSNDIVTEFQTAAESLFEISMGQFNVTIEVVKDTHFSYMVQEYTAPTDEEVRSVMRTLLPKSISRKMVLREMMNRVPQEVDRNCGRVRYDLTSRIRKTIDYYAKQLREIGEDLISQIESALQKGQEMRMAGSEKIQKELDSLAINRTILKENRANILKILNTIHEKSELPEQIKTVSV